MAALSAAMPEAKLDWCANERRLVCSFPAAAGGVAEVNRKLLPALLAQADVISVMPGRSLEEAFLDFPGR
jgi:hypothetical protein